VAQASAPVQREWRRPPRRCSVSGAGPRACAARVAQASAPVLREWWEDDSRLYRLFVRRE